MADLIQIKAGSGTPPVLQDRELAYSRSEKALYIGTKEGNVKLGGEGGSGDVSADIVQIKADIESIFARLAVLEK